MKTKIYKKLILSLGVFLFACVSLLTTTFAWFSIAQDATVGDLSMSISGGQELLVSLDGVNFFDNLTSEEIQKAFGENVSITNVTTTDLDVYHSSYSYDQLSLANKDYITFDLWFKTNDALCNGLFLTNNLTPTYNYETAKNESLRGTYCFSKGVEYTNPVDFQYSESELRTANTKATYYAADAMRIGIKELNVDVVELNEVDTREELQKFIYDPSEDEERGFGSIYGALDLLKKRLDGSVTPPVQKPDTKYQLSMMEYNYYATSNASHCATFQQGTDGAFYAKVRVSIWCEGWDADCLDGILNDHVLVQLYFRCAVPYTEEQN